LLIKVSVETDQKIWRRLQGYTIYRLRFFYGAHVFKVSLDAALTACWTGEYVIANVTIIICDEPASPTRSECQVTLG
jgi:hypothetical protein